ncbi:uncharacterized protein Pyn_07731 [Prunus yedoensis var. nudiflora]|uniref:Uncharacterized protein n=1 Tax=Prunus yedoensis var. nudiflora TaxID=2094558 RepID=A0A314ZSY5_PRUYE|nr:uncharacterized protein Pyn_07731 [Prunus yedoensis var. nudiflora]
MPRNPLIALLGKVTILEKTFCIGHHRQTLLTLKFLARHKMSSVKQKPTWNSSLYNCDINYPQLTELELARSPHNKTEQTYMQLWEENLRLQNLKVLKDKEILKWVARNGLPENIKTKIMENITKLAR